MLKNWGPVVWCPAKDMLYEYIRVKYYWECDDKAVMLTEKLHFRNTRFWYITKLLAPTFMLATVEAWGAAKGPWRRCKLMPPRVVKVDLEGRRVSDALEGVVISWAKPYQPYLYTNGSEFQVSCVPWQTQKMTSGCSNNFTCLINKNTCEGIGITLSMSSAN